MRAQCDSWYVLEVFGGDKSVQFLQLSGHTVSRPTYVRHSLHHRTKKKLETRLYLFPGYLFIRLPEFGVADWRQVLSSPGVGDVLGIEGVPEPMPRGLVEQLEFECRCGMYDEHLAAPEKKKPSVVIRALEQLKDFKTRLTGAPPTPLMA